MPTASPAEIPKYKKRFAFTVASVPPVEKIFFVQNLGLMIRTGFSIGDALAVLGVQTKNRLLKKTIVKLHSDVIAGETFSAALAKHMEVFDELFVSMVAAGEMSGNLEETLKQITIQMKKSYSLKKKIRTAMMYPVLILVFMLIMGTLVFIFVIPKILDLYSGEQSNIPLPTRIVLTISTFIRTETLWIGVSASMVVLILYWIWRTEKGRLLMSKLLLRLPIFGAILKKIAIARIMRVLHSLITTDIPIVKGFQIIARTVGNRVYRQQLLRSSELLTKGNSIYSTIAPREDLFDPVIAQMIKVGEDTGSVDEMTDEIATFYEDEVESVMANLTVIIEPILMLVIGAGVGFIAVAIIMPIYGLVNQV